LLQESITSLLLEKENYIQGAFEIRDQMNQKFGSARLTFFCLIATSSFTIQWISVSAFQPFSPTLSSNVFHHRSSESSSQGSSRQGRNTDLTSLSATQEATSPTSTKEKDDLSRGDARGAALLLDDISVSRGTSQILSNINWRIEPKSKFALVGTNGAGKVSYGFQRQECAH